MIFSCNGLVLSYSFVILSNAIINLTSLIRSKACWYIKNAVFNGIGISLSSVVGTGLMWPSWFSEFSALVEVVAKRLSSSSL